MSAVIEMCVNTMTDLNILSKALQALHLTYDLSGKTVTVQKELINSYRDLVFTLKNGIIEVKGDSDFLSKTWINKLHSQYTLLMIKHQAYIHGYTIESEHSNGNEIELVLDNICV